MVNQSADFKKATENSRKLKAQPANEELLELYGLFKQGSGEDFTKATAPSAFNFKEKYKYNAWKEVQTVKPADAQTKYVKLVKTLQDKYGTNE